MWTTYRIDNTMPVGAKIIIDLAGTTITDSAPDALKYSWRYIPGVSDPPGTEGGDTPNYAEDLYPFLSIFGYYMHADDTTTLFSAVYDESMSPGMLESPPTMRVYTYIAPTRYPAIPNSGITNGLMSVDTPFQYSWSKSAFVYSPGGDYESELSGNPDSQITGFYGNWSIIDNYYLNYVLTSPHYFTALAISTEIALNTYPFEYLKTHRLFSNAPRTMDGMVVGPDLKAGGDHRDIYDDAELDEQPKNQHYWPQYSLEKHPTGHADRNYRAYHASMNMNFSEHKNVHRDLYQRFFHPSYNRSQRDNFIGKRVEALETMLSIAEQLPKEHRIRMQPQVQLQDSQLNFLPLMSAEATTSAPTPTSAMSDGGGSSDY